VNEAVSYEGLATAQAYLMELDPEWIPAMSKNLQLCDQLGQLYRFIGQDGRCYGYIAWLRVEHRHVPLLKATEWDRIFQLPAAELKTGPVLYIIETMTMLDGLSGRAGRQLSRLPGVERIAAHIRDRWRERRVVHHGCWC
jgi:hypothetical protein